MPWRLSVLKLPIALPYDWVHASAFYSITRTPDEFSIVCETTFIPHTLEQQDGWQCLMIEGVLDFSLVGILARISGVLAQAGISIFAISTYNTDYILLKATNMQRALENLQQNGYDITT
jgi:hypothetical protein